MIDKEKIRKEVERLQDLTMDENKNFYSEAAEGEYNALCNIEHFIGSLQEEPGPQFKIGDTICSKVWESAVHEIVSMDDSAYYFENGGKVEIANQEQWELAEETVSVWHNASEEPNDMSHCLIFYGCKESVGHYLDYEPVLYNKKEKVFVTSSFPHPTGYKVEQKSIDGGCVAEVYKNKRDRISILDITQWCYLYDLHNLSNVQRTIKNRKEPVSDDLEKAAMSCGNSVVQQVCDELSKEYGGEYIPSEDSILLVAKYFKAGAKWQREKDQKK